MAFQDFLLRARRPVSLVAFNDALPNNFKLIHNPGDGFVVLPGVNIDQIDSLLLLAGDPAMLSGDVHYNLRVIGGPEVAHHAFSGWDGLFIEAGDPDFDDGEGSGDTRLDNSKLKRWFKNNGGELLDDSSEHPRSGRSDMRWWRWTDGTERMDITIDDPVFQRRVWL